MKFCMRWEVTLVDEQLLKEDLDLWQVPVLALVVVLGLLYWVSNLERQTFKLE